MILAKVSSVYRGLRVGILRLRKDQVEKPTTGHGSVKEVSRAFLLRIPRLRSAGRHITPLRLARSLNLRG